MSTPISPPPGNGGNGTPVPTPHQPGPTPPPSSPADEPVEVADAIDQLAWSLAWGEDYTDAHKRALLSAGVRYIVVMPGRDNSPHQASPCYQDITVSAREGWSDEKPGNIQIDHLTLAGEHLAAYLIAGGVTPALYSNYAEVMKAHGKMAAELWSALNEIYLVSQQRG